MTPIFSPAPTSTASRWSKPPPPRTCRPPSSVRSHSRRVFETGLEGICASPTTISSAPPRTAHKKSACRRSSSRCSPTATSIWADTKGWYDEGQEEFVTETEAKNHEYKSAISGRPLTRYSEKPSYFFRLSKYVPRVLEYIEAHPDFMQPESRRNEVISKLKAGVDDLSISRATLKWGIPMPHDPEHVVYVWIDALSNYITALGYGSGTIRSCNKFWPANVHLIGKDILWFHAVYWPAMLLSAGASGAAESCLRTGGGSPTGGK